MTTLEQEIIEKFHQLDRHAQLRVRALIEHETAQDSPAAPFDYAGWMRDVENIRGKIRASHGGTFPNIDVVGMLREIRDGEPLFHSGDQGASSS
ncbi:MAG: hypothetical protein JNM70_09150 [Anaerolineae bacterium]|nr:hypothetical protein [Anaerolineae bacterium]